MGHSKRLIAASFTIAFAALLSDACGGTSTAVGTCTTGQSIACAGPGGCTGFQSCNTAGTYDPCTCGGGGGSGTDGGTSGSDASAGSDASGGSDSGDSTEDGGSFSPSDLPGLVLWLNDQGIVTDPAHPDNVVHWSDESGSGNDATGVCANSCPGEMPQLDPSGAHGHDAVSLFASEFTLADATSLQFGTGDWGLAFVFKPQASSQYGVTLWQKYDTSSPMISFGNYNDTSYEARDGADTVSSTIVDNGSFQYFILRGPALSLQTPSGTSTGPTSTDDISNPGAMVQLGWNSSLNSAPCEIAEVIAVKGTLSDASVAKLIAYFHKKFGT